MAVAVIDKSFLTQTMTVASYLVCPCLLLPHPDPVEIISQRNREKRREGGRRQGDRESFNILPGLLWDSEQTTDSLLQPLVSKKTNQKRHTRGIHSELSGAKEQPSLVFGRQAEKRKVHRGKKKEGIRYMLISGCWNSEAESRLVERGYPV